MLDSEQVSVVVTWYTNCCIPYYITAPNKEINFFIFVALLLILSFYSLILVHYKWWPLDYKNSDCSQLRIKKKNFSFTSASFRRWPIIFFTQYIQHYGGQKVLILMAFSEEKMPSQLAELADRIADTYHQKPSVSQVLPENHKEDKAVSYLCKRCSTEKKSPS